MTTKISELDTKSLSHREKTSGAGTILIRDRIRLSMKNPDHHVAWIFWPIVLLPLAVFWQIVTYHGQGAPEITLDTIDSRWGIILLVLPVVMAIVVHFVGKETSYGEGDPVKTFAMRNNLFLATNKKLPDDFECVIFQQNKAHKHELFISDRQHDPYYFIATYQFMGARAGEFGNLYTVMSIKLPEVVTPILIDATANNIWRKSNLPSGYKIGPQLYVEGDFQKYFRLYCVTGEEREVLRIITPDRMALFVDGFKDWDIELWKDRMFFYKKSDISYEGRELPELFTLLETVQQEFENI